ncbi:putative xanthine dehydrogenase subunit A [Caulifigura coniformis]|uniref:Putative xanthine dehydrogenase subunit A n=1 Tax=Caulifigura coniformis TaxID=2527983 RepID=A0A517SE98_9PLAN|nr:XdhC/CoxI family protein [Caulifigura coniformis]QDT54446.1 putative xanthine dehydrogenase subunit A [Caulifigura coniformis]
MRDVFAALCNAANAGRPCLFTALVETRGSTPQKAGAAMLVFADGAQIGTLGGGCVEAEVKRRALERITVGGPELMTFQLDSDYGWDDGLICGGRMKMLVDAIRPGNDLSYYRACSERATAGQGFTQAVILEDHPDAPPGSQFLFDVAGSLLASRPAGLPPESVGENLRSISSRPRPYVVSGVTYLPSLPRCRLIIVGAGHVGQKTAELAADVDFDVWVIDDREEYCSPERFPRAQQLIAGPIGRELKALETTPDDFLVIVTRGHNHDEEALYRLIGKPFRYLGMIGSRRKIRMIFDDLRKEGVSPSALERVHAPLGFDIGSQTVPEIAVSIVSQLIAVRNRGESVSTVHALRDTVRAASGT